jgi:hypothetical protein
VPRERTFVGVLGRWGIAEDADAPSLPGVYRQSGRLGPTDAPRVIVSDLVFRDLTLRVSCRPDAGVTGEGCGLVFDATGSDDYFAVRADTLQGRLCLIHVRAGDEREIATASAQVVPHLWHSITVRTRAQRVVVDWDGERLLDAVDWSRTGGKIGLTTSADAVTSFDDLEAMAD